VAGEQDQRLLGNDDRLVAICSMFGRWKSKRWQRSMTVAGIFWASVVARTKSVFGGGSSSVLRNAFQAAVDSM
jgi:hypothetical protein